MIFFFQQSGCSLHILQMKCTGMKSSSFSLLKEAVTNNKSLTSLNVSANEVRIALINTLSIWWNTIICAWCYDYAMSEVFKTYLLVVSVIDNLNVWFSLYPGGYKWCSSWFCSDMYCSTKYHIIRHWKYQSKHITGMDSRYNTS